MKRLFGTTVFVFAIFGCGIDDSRAPGPDGSPPRRRDDGCTPTSCKADKQCGTIPDGCGGTLTCGCAGGFSCVNGTCQRIQCQAEPDAVFCSRLNRNCGSVKGRDNCGDWRTVICGTCPAGQSCDDNTCKSKTCTPLSDSAFCAALGKNCGTVSNKDNCGNPRTVSCGSCTTGQSCVAGVCSSTFSGIGSTVTACQGTGSAAGTVGGVKPVFNSGFAARMEGALNVFLFSRPAVSTANFPGQVGEHKMRLKIGQSTGKNQYQGLLGIFDWDPTNNKWKNLATPTYTATVDVVDYHVVSGTGLMCNGRLIGQATALFSPNDVVVVTFAVPILTPSFPSGV